MAYYPWVDAAGSALIAMTGAFVLLQTVLRWRSFSKGMRIVSFCGLGIAASFLFYGLTGLLDWPGHELREFVHITSFLLFWSIVTRTLLRRRPSRDLMFVLLLAGSLSLAATFILGVNGASFFMLVCLALLMHYNSLVKGASLELTQAAIIANVAVAAWMLEVYSEVAGLPIPHGVLDFLRAFLYLAAIFLYYRHVRPGAFVSRMQRRVVNGAFRI